MEEFQTISSKAFNESTFEIIGKNWMLITASNNNKVNTMTASWGGLGYMWNKNVAYIVIRPQRYTKEFVDSSSTFSLSFLPNTFRKTLNYLGSTSGRDENKIERSNLNILYKDETPYFKEADIVMICKKLYNQAFLEECFIDKTIVQKCYESKDFHILYIAEVTDIFIKK